MKNNQNHPTRPIFVMDKELSDIFFKIEEFSVAYNKYLDSDKVPKTIVKSLYENDFSNIMVGLQASLQDLLGEIINEHVCKFTGKEESCTE